MQSKKIRHEFPYKIKGPLFEPKRFKIFYGGRSSGKSNSVARFLVLQAHKNPVRILCTRELQNSLKDSVWKLLSDVIHEFELTDFFTINKDGIHGRNGSEFIFIGLKNDPKKVKSTESIDYCFCEEAESITEESWDLLIPTIRKSNSEIIVVFNPSDELDPTYQRFIAPFQSDLDSNDGIYLDDRHTVVKMNYADNPFLPDEAIEEMRACKVNDYKKYLHIWQGEVLADYEDSVIDPLWVRASIDAHIKLGFKPMGVRSLGYDCADKGKDSKAFMVRHGSVIVDGKQWHDGDISDANDRVYEYASGNRIDHIVYDAIGVGAAVKEYFRRMQGNNSITIKGFVGSEAPHNPEGKYKEDRYNQDVFRNARAQAFWHLRDRFEATYQAIEKGDYVDPDKMISLSSDIPDIKVLISELSRIQRKRSNNTSIQIESKDDMARRGMPSPGMADSLMYCFQNKAVNVNNPEWNTPLNM